MAEARDRGYDTAGWQAVPNPLLIDPGTSAGPPRANETSCDATGQPRSSPG